MAFAHGKASKVFVNQTEFSTYLNNVDVARTNDVAESTTFGKSSKTYIAGNQDGTFSVGGFFDATADATLQPLVGGSDFVFVMGIDGVDALDRCSFAQGNITNYGVSSPVGDIVASSIDIQADSGLYNGLVLENATITASGNGTARDNTTSTANGGGAFILATAVSGSTPNLTAKIQHSADNVTYVDLVTFTSLTSAGAEFKQVAKGTTVNRYLKVNYTVTGSTPSFAVIIGFGRNN
jgi:hypothetical protein